MYDEYLIGYISRHIALHPDYRHHAHDNSGTFWNVVLLDGNVVGNWSNKGNEIVTYVFKPGLELNGNALEQEKSKLIHELNYSEICTSTEYKCLKCGKKTSPRL